VEQQTNTRVLVFFHITQLPACTRAFTMQLRVRMVFAKKSNMTHPAKRPKEQRVLAPDCSISLPLIQLRADTAHVPTIC
jgi:hypothetical protein